ncbi:MAG: AmmeMemoRadiSam system protein B [bacterium]|jgi:AmmeMemoRadiSam system protein B
MKIRNPVVVNKFYPENYIDLLKIISKDISVNDKINELNNKEILGLVLPHAGYVYSAKTALKALFLAKNFIKNIDTLILIGPDHYSYGKNISIDDRGYLIPKDIIFQPNIDIINIIKTKKDYIQLNYDAFNFEHSLEVILPLIYFVFNKTFKIVPITITKQSLNNSLVLANILFEALKDKDNFLIIASSDMSHYISHDQAINKDSKVFNYIIQNDSIGFYRAIIDNEINSCGFGCITTLLEFKKLIYSYKNLNNINNVIVEYETSAHYSKDYDFVVGYLSVIV